MFQPVWRRWSEMRYPLYPAPPTPTTSRPFEQSFASALLVKVTDTIFYPSVLPPYTAFVSGTTTLQALKMLKYTMRH